MTVATALLDMLAEAVSENAAETFNDWIEEACERAGLGGGPSMPILLNGEGAEALADGALRTLQRQCIDAQRWDMDADPTGEVPAIAVVFSVAEDVAPDLEVARSRRLAALAKRTAVLVAGDWECPMLPDPALWCLHLPDHRVADLELLRSADWPGV